MSHGVPYFYFKNGKGRWIPSAALKKEGKTSLSLLDDKGEFLALGPAIEAARRINAALPAISPKRKHRAKLQNIDKMTSGQIYFLVCGDAVKIGFSTNLKRRLAALSTGMPAPETCIVSVSGIKHHETILHAKLDHLRITGEWFKLTQGIRKLMAACALLGYIPFEEKNGLHRDFLLLTPHLRRKPTITRNPPKTTTTKGNSLLKSTA